MSVENIPVQVSCRITAGLLAEAKDLGINISEVLREALAKAIEERKKQINQNV